MNGTRSFLDDVALSIPPKNFEWMQSIFESRLSDLLGSNWGRVSLVVVVDSTMINSAINNLVKGKGSIFLKLKDHPIFRLYAPPLLVKEVYKFISKQKGDKSKYIQAWMEISQSLRFQNRVSDISKYIAGEITKRDPTDTAFVAVCIETGSDVILTYDKDFTDLPLKNMNIKQFRDVIFSYYRGLLSFIFVGELTPAVVSHLISYIGGFLKAVFDHLELIYNSIMGAVYKAGENIHRSLGEAARPFGLAAEHLEIGLSVLGIGAISYLLSDQKIRRGLESSITNFIKQAGSELDKLIDWLEPLLVGLSEILKILQLIFPELARTALAHILSLVTNILWLLHEIRKRSPRMLPYS
jgi:predicted nucleic acid-binding protein